MSKITIIEGNSNDKDNVRAIMVKGEKGEKGDNGEITYSDVIDNLTSTETQKPLSAKQGKILKDLADANTSNISSNAENIDNERSVRQSADTTLQNNINSEATARTSADASLQSQISSLASGSPLKASSTSEMTDTSRIYVNTTDGNWYYYNGSAWTIGGVYQSTGIGDDSVSYSMLDLDLKSFIDNNRIIQKNDFVKGGISVTTGANQWNEKRARTDYISILKNTANFKNTSISGYTMSMWLYRYDLNDTFIDIPLSGVQPTSAGVLAYELTNQYKYRIVIRVIIDGTEHTITDEILENLESNILIDDGQLVGDSETVEKLVEEVEGIKPYVPAKITITVGTDKDYTTIADAIASITDASSTKIYDILIDDGTYNEKDLTLPDYVNLIGASGNRENCIIRGYLDPSSSDSVINPCSTINMNKNNNLKNLTITAQNMRYPVHCESGGTQTDWTAIIDNCYIEHFGNQEVKDYRTEHSGDPTTVWSAYHAWGMGISSNAHFVMKNTTLKSQEIAFYSHSQANVRNPYLIELENCKLLSSNIFGGAIAIDDSQSPIGNSRCYVKNCYLFGRISIIASINGFDMMVSSSGKSPVYQRPERYLSNVGFPIFTDFSKKYIAGENLTSGTFVKSDDGGMTVTKANSTTPLNEILGYTIGNANNGNEILVVNNGYMQGQSSHYPEVDFITAGEKYKIGDNGKLTLSSSTDDIIVAISNVRGYKLLI